ncbi:hypothetical protein [Nonomuraea diastatica]|uniref:PE domain-containing protein n=1 Tax=Nonomuraea diastatica TaxID=1848329 RepID=A0A4R4X4A7_9ACTN|nr:hypothetical protein [Nonomuraea diastatica]TDD25148.1 hypothetical protein E1294_04060 [Nonomuraea diastatica]
MAETEPPRDWPGLQPERDGVTYDPKKIANIAGELREVLKPIRGEGRGENQGSIIDLETYGSLRAVLTHVRSIERWQGGQAFADLVSHSQQEFLTAYEEVLENFATAISLVEAGAGTYQVTNAANEGGV